MPNEVEQRLREIEGNLAELAGHAKLSVSSAAYQRDVPFLLSLLREREEENRRLRILLEQARTGAWHEACGDHEDPDPCWHCCDWRELAQDIDRELGGERGDPSAAPGVRRHP